MSVSGAPLIVSSSACAAVAGPRTNVGWVLRNRRRAPWSVSNGRSATAAGTARPRSAACSAQIPTGVVLCRPNREFRRELPAGVVLAPNGGPKWLFGDSARASGGLGNLSDDPGMGVITTRAAIRAFAPVTRRAPAPGGSRRRARSRGGGAPGPTGRTRTSSGAAAPDGRTACRGRGAAPRARRG